MFTQAVKFSLNASLKIAMTKVAAINASPIYHHANHAPINGIL